jgi:hypothetical protein
VTDSRGEPGSIIHTIRTADTLNAWDRGAEYASYLANYGGRQRPIEVGPLFEVVVKFTVDAALLQPQEENAAFVKCAFEQALSACTNVKTWNAMKFLKSKKSRYDGVMAEGGRFAPR